MLEFFSDTYAESRRKFRSLVNASSGHLISLSHPSAVTPDGDPLSMDVAVFGASPARKVFFNINGTHGNESYSGGAAQIDWIASGKLNYLPKDVAVILVHSVNPYGWAYDSQLNENGVNLNRNFVDFDNLPQSDDFHFDLQSRFEFKELSYEALKQAWDDYEDVRKAVGDNRFNSSFMTGQYIAQRTINFGGTEPEWSNLTLRALAEEVLSKAEKIALADYHTGLGEYGHPYELPFWQEGTEAWDQTVQWWGEAAVRRGSHGVMHDSEGSDAAASAFNGVAFSALRDAAPNAVIAGGIIEFGTVGFKPMIQGCVLDLWLAFNDLEEHPEYRFWKMLSRETLSPSDDVWRTSVLQYTRSYHDKMLAGLIDW